MTERKRPRRTRERVLETGLALFNQFGEPNVTTTMIAETMRISPGNLYYHFRNKDEIVNDIFAGFRKEVGRILVAPQGEAVSVEDVWLFLHLFFELIWKYRFLYRDLNDLMTRNRTVEIHFKTIIADLTRTIAGLAAGMAKSGEIDARSTDAAPLATNLAVVITYWLSFAYARDPRRFDESAVVGEGAYQVLSMLAPHLTGTGRVLFERLAAQYRSGMSDH